jgi:cobalt transporter subunit CbtB
MQNQMSVDSSRAATTRSTSFAKPLQLAAIFLLGAVMMFGVGFAQTSAVHNAAHDMRHAQGFPCH